MKSLKRLALSVWLWFATGVLSSGIFFVVNVAHAQNLELVSPKSKLTFSLRDLKAKLKTTVVKIDDPVYGKAMQYDAFALEDVLKLANVSLDDHADELVFTATDGYAPNTSFDKLKSHKAYLAYQEHGAKPGKFAQVAQGKAMVSPAPFYVVWGEGTKLKTEVPWPYQLAKIEVVDWMQKYSRVVPPDVSETSAERKGFMIFKAECIRCHSINLQGGDLGPELNSPQSITEYWKADVLRAYIQNNSNFRYKSKMPLYKHFTAEQMDQLIAYLTHMKNYQIRALQ